MRGAISVFILLALCASVFAICGNSICEFGENCDTCPGDCAPCRDDMGYPAAHCGDGFCTWNPVVNIETYLNCYLDCRGNNSNCGNSICEFGENCDTCPGDCAPCRDDMGYPAAHCGDGFCTWNPVVGNETSSNCYLDCRNVCGDGFCSGNETCYSCPADCKLQPNNPGMPCCGNGVCDRGENLEGCPGDCVNTPDLYIRLMSVYPQNPVLGTQVTILVTVSNGGIQPAPTSTLGLYIDGARYSEVQTPALQPAGSYSRNFTYTVTRTPNPHTVTAVADLYDVIIEGSERNNNDTRFINVTVPTRQCGDTNNDGKLNGADVTYLVNYLKGGPAPSPLYYADVDGNGVVNNNDAIRLANYFKGTATLNCPIPRGLAMVSGPPMQGNVLAIFAAVALISLGVYAFMRSGK